MYIVFQEKNYGSSVILEQMYILGKFVAAAIYPDNEISCDGGTWLQDCITSVLSAYHIFAFKHFLCKGTCNAQFGTT